MATTAGKPVRQRWLTWAAIGVCALAVWCVYGSTRHFHFVVWDDDYNIQQNPHLSGLTWDNLRWTFTDTAYARRYFPLTWLGWNVEHDLFGLTAHSAHLGNVLFHLLNTVLVFFVIKSGIRLWSAPRIPPDEWPATVAATLGALLWALHPLRVEVVAWASGRIYAQSGCFLLLATWAFFLSLEAGPNSPRGRRLRWASVAAFALSLLTYPLALSFVGILLAVDWYRPNGPTVSGLSATQRLKPLLLEKMPFLAVTAVTLAVTLWARANVQAVGWKPPITLQEFGVVPRVMQACYVWVYYLAKPLWPVDLSPFYTRLISFQPSDGTFLLSLFVVVTLSVILFWQRRRWPGLWLLWLCHLIVLIPMLGLTEHPHFTSDRYSYLAAVPCSVAIAVVIVRVWSNRPRRVASLFAIGAVIAAGSALSIAQVYLWQDTKTLGLHMIVAMGDHPRRFDIYARIASSLRDEGKNAESNAYYVKSLAGDPHAAENALQQARNFETAGKLPEAFGQYLLASQLRPDLAEPKFRIGTLLMQQDRAAEALPFLRDAVRLEPGSADIQISLGWALNWTNQSPEAIPHLEAGLRVQPNDIAGHSGLGVALLATGRPREAVPHFEEVVRQYPNAALAHMQLGLALLDGLGRKADAAAQFEIVLKLQPDFRGAADALERSRK